MSGRISILLVFLVAPATFAQNPLAKKPAEQPYFVGTFAGQGVTIELGSAAGSGAQTGSLTFEGKTYPCTGSQKGDVFSGEFSVGRENFPLRLDKTPDGVTLETGGTKYALAKQRPANPLARGGGHDAPRPPQPPPNEDRPQPPPAGAPTGGIGVAFMPNAKNELQIAQVLPGGPAAKAGIQPGGILRNVNDRSVEGLTPDQLRGLIGGEPGTVVNLLVEQGNDFLDVAVERADLSKLIPGPDREPAPPPPGQMPPGPGGFAPPPVLPGAAPVRHAAAPEWMKPGLRINYWAGSATIPGAGQVLVPDDKGNWVAKDGKKWSVQDNPGAGGMGYQQFTVNDIVGDSVIINFRQYLLHTDVKACTTIAAEGHVMSLAQGSETWVPPERLRAMQPGETNGVRVLRGPYNLNGRTYDAVSVVTRVSNGATRCTYDTSTGLLLAMGSSTIGAGQLSAPVNGRATPVAGSTMLAQVLFLGTRQTHLPWTGQRAPAAVAGIRLMEFGGSYTTSVPGVGDYGWPATLRWDFNQIDPHTAKYRATYYVNYGNNNGVPNDAQVTDRISSVSMFWLDPQILGQLREGQVLDQDPLTNIRTVVAAANQNAVAIAEQGQIENGVAVFDPRTGLLQGLSLQQRAGLGSTLLKLQRTR